MKKLIVLLMSVLVTIPAQAEPRQIRDLQEVDSLLPVEVVRSDQFVESFDGVKIDTSLFLSEETPPPGGWPAIIFVHGGGSNKEQWMPRAKMYAAQGYATMTISCRGHGNSTGITTAGGLNEANDLIEVVSWLGKTAPVNPDRIAVTGSSNGGGNSWQITVNYPRLRTSIPMNIWGSSDFYKVNNVLQHRILFVMIGAFNQGRDRLDKRIIHAVIMAYKDKEGDKEMVGLEQAHAPMLRAADLGVPVLVRGAWLDESVLAQNVIDMYHAVGSVKQLQMTTGGHHSPTPPEELIYDEARMRMWFDYWLKGIDNGILDEPPVMYSIPFTENPSNLGEWIHRAFDVWPPPAEPTRYYLDSARVLTGDEPQAKDSTFTYKNDVPVMDITVKEYDNAVVRMPATKAPVGQVVQEGLLVAAYGMSPPMWEPDRVVLRSQPLRKPLEFAGNYRVHVYANSTGEEFQLDTQLIDIDGAGVVQHTAATGVYGVRDNVPGEIHEIEYIGLASTYVFEAGHRIGLVVTNAQFPRFKPYLNPANITVYCDSEHPSYIEIPTVQPFADVTWAPLTGRVTGIKAIAEDDGIKVSWAAVSDEVVGYKVFRNRPTLCQWDFRRGPLYTDGPVQIGYVKAAKTEFLDTDVKPGAEYTYYVSSVAAGGVEGQRCGPAEIAW